MEELLKKLCYKGQKRIAVIDAPDLFYNELSDALSEVQSDRFIDPRYLYDFIIAFAILQDDIIRIGPQAIHNLSPDGKLWVAFPRSTSGKYSTDINRDNGWESFEQAGYKRVSQIIVDIDWTALRFRNKKYIKSINKEE